MQKFYFLSMVSVLTFLTACYSNPAVKVAKSVDRSTMYPQQMEVKQDVPADLPGNVTAICRDGSYSTATTQMCAGNGGVKTVIRRYYAE